MPGRVTCIEMVPDPAWDALVEDSAGGDLVQTTPWAVSRRRLGFRCLHVKVAGPGPTPVGGCLLYAKRVGPGVWVGSVPRGPLLFGEGRDLARSVVQAVVTAAWHRGVRFLVMQPPEGADAIEAAMTEAGFRAGVPGVAPEATLRIDLRRDDDALLGRMSAMRRRNIRKALRAGFDIGEERDVAVFHRLHAATAARQGFVPISLDNLRAQYEALAPTDRCVTFIARHGGMPVAGLWLTRFAGTITWKLSGWDATGAAPPNANEAVHWAVMRWARERGDRTYDLGGIDRQDAQTICSGGALPEGPRHARGFFKLAFGGTPVLLPCARFILTHRFVDLTLGGAAQRALAMPAVMQLVKRMRNG
jgi:peptidoglycan pentaglycine glycine transferase (the first glycine)